ncbi:MAG: DUF2961 domain-containing protein [Thermogemmatispora sp.]|uniref:DUF2961 domain-containing protein n=1 Tax=Thermogemmatispora sp. TaxID=1968838 RepID=UPI00261A4D00|nr:DUF2961 domain-containing protein [Thermogemmatispora sp.]MBX5456285.1 DUF2961 domain-containing protein [Thermogemmatispora sp.]
MAFVMRVQWPGEYWERKISRGRLLLYLALFVMLLPLLVTLAGRSATGFASVGGDCTALFLSPGRTAPLYLGLAAYRFVDKLAYLEIGDRVLGLSTADLYGNNADSSHYLRSLAGGGRVLFDALGPGLLTFARMQEEIGAPWLLYRDGELQKFSASDLGQRRPTSQTASRFPYPFSLNPSEDEGSSIIALPLPFAQRLTLSTTHRNGNFYALYRRLPWGIAPPQCPSSTIAQTATLVSTHTPALPAAASKYRQSGQLTVSPGKRVTFLTLQGPAQVRELTFRVPLSEAVAFGRSWLSIAWDGERRPSVAAPVKFLAGDGAGLYQPAGRPLVAGWLATIQSEGSGDQRLMAFHLYWPMPFSRSARFMLQSSQRLTAVDWSVAFEPFPDPPSWWGTFHATYTSVSHPPQGQALTLLDVRGSGKLVGTVINFWRPDGTLEGNPEITLDDSLTPQIEVTGTEEWGLGGDYWHGGRQTSLPLGGFPSGPDNPPGSERDGAALYRFLVADSIPFNRHLVFRLGHGSHNQSPYPYRALLLWYGTARQTATLSDTLLPAQAGSRLQHGYQATDEHFYDLRAAAIYQQGNITRSGTVSATGGAISFSLRLTANNVGAFLRRLFDYCTPNQSAAVYVDGAFAGIWYSAGVANHGPPGSPRRCWREEDYPLPAQLTAGKSAIHLRLVPVSLSQTSLSAWTAFRYQAYSFLP